MATKIHEKLKLKQKQRKCISLLCSCYVYAMIRYIMNQPALGKRKVVSPTLLEPCVPELCERSVVLSTMKLSVEKIKDGKYGTKSELQSLIVGTSR